jgi:hypothetical protein
MRVLDPSQRYTADNLIRRRVDNSKQVYIMNTYKDVARYGIVDPLPSILDIHPASRKVNSGFRLCPTLCLK